MDKIIQITNFIHIVRGQKIMLDRDLAELYGVEVKVLNQTVRRNIERFPEEFMFQLNFNELEVLRSQFVTANALSDQNYKSRSFPYAFTEAGSFALSFILNTEKAIEMGHFIIKAFTHLRRFVLKNENLMIELKNNDHLSKTFAQFEKRIEHDLLILYKNNSTKEKEIKKIKEDILEIKRKIGI